MKEIVFQNAFNAYRVVLPIGEGGSGRVYKVLDENEKEFAIKSLDEKVVTKERLKRFKNELFFCLKSIHKNIIKVLEHGDYEVNGVRLPFYVMYETSYFG